MSDTYASQGSDLYAAPTKEGSSKEEDSKITAKKVREAWDRGCRSTKSERQQAAINQRFVLNKHWVYWNPGTDRLEELPRTGDRVRATIAKIGPDSVRIIAKLTSRPLAWEVLPKSPDDGAVTASRISEAALAQVSKEQSWEQERLDHADTTWESGVGGVCVEWDSTAGTPIDEDETGRIISTGDVLLTVVSLDEMAFEPGTRDAEKARYWVRGIAVPPSEAKDRYNLSKTPKADARAINQVWRSQDTGKEETPLTMVFTYFQRPHNNRPGTVVTVIDNEIVEETDWPFPFSDRLNIGMCVVKKIHGVWHGHTPVTDAVPVQAAFNASWSSIIEHMKQAGNARLWVPFGSVDDIEDLSDKPGEAMEYNPINGQRPEFESPPTMPDWWIRQPDMLGAQMDNILGQNEVSRGGAPGGIESGIALSVLAENDDTMIGRYGRNMADMWGRVGSMVLKLYEVKSKETRSSLVAMPHSKLPEVIKWNGGDLLGHTDAYVPTDAVMPRNRSAQQAYAFQLYDRGIITSATELARVADLPDQDDLLSGIDPDTARAQRENAAMAGGASRTVDTIDDHKNHIHIHRNFMRSERFENLDMAMQEIYRQHLQGHTMYAAQQAAEQALAASMSPMAAMLPSEQTSVLNPEDLASGMAISSLAPSGPGMSSGISSPMDMTGFVQQSQAPAETSGNEQIASSGSDEQQPQE
jgi:hypothetical protein